MSILFIRSIKLAGLKARDLHGTTDGDPLPRALAVGPSAVWLRGAPGHGCRRWMGSDGCCDYGRKRPMPVIAGLIGTECRTK